ncbi:hypothetical protein ABVK25_004539 [Lepraria finkii]|uniref:N-acetyltransferase domain-containing protein n=1 Tax=Lepraria finkii TaxID=1340010 RepID=A0ABR4BEA5_9LECA
MLNDTCLAGLWSRLLPIQLIWFVRDAKQANCSPAKRPPFYRAPSWSWASVDGEVSAGTVSYDGILITVTSAKVTPATNDETGQVEDGYFVLRGKLSPARLYRHATIDELQLRVNTKELELGCSVYPDVEPGDISAALICLPIMEYMVDQEPWIWGLILEADQLGKGFYKRFGMFMAHGLESCEIFKDSTFNEDVSGLHVDGDTLELYLI